MRFFCFFLISTALMSCSTLAPERTPLGSLKLTKKNKLYNINISIEKKKQSLPIDTSSVFTSVKNQGFKNVGQKIYIDSKGHKTTCAVLNPKNMMVGNLEFKEPFVISCKKNTFIGLDYLSEQPFELNYKKATLTFLEKLPGFFLSHKNLHKTKNGLFNINVQIGSHSLMAHIDSSLQRSKLDFDFINNNPKHFDFSKGKKSLYTLDNLTIGGHEFKKITLEGTLFGKTLKKNLSNPKMIIGLDILTKAKWTFDYKKKKYLISSF